MAAKDIEAGRAFVLLRIRDQLTQGLKLAEKRMQRFGTYVATSAAVIGGSAFAGLAWPLKLSADIEQASVSFEVFLGSADAAKKLLDEIETMAAKTPFQFDDLKDSAKLLMGFGATVEQVLPMMQMLGDISGGNAEKFQRLSLAFGQTMAKGRLMGQEVNQMTEQGFNPLQYIAKVTGKTVAVLMKEMEAGQVSFPMLVAGMQKATSAGERFNGMMDKQSTTLTGLFSTLIDYSKMAGRAFGDTLVPVFKSLIVRAIDLAKGFAIIVRANAPLIATIGTVIIVVGAVAGAFLALGAAVVAGGFAVGLMASAFAFIGSTIALTFSPLGALIAILAGLVGTAIYFRSAIAEAFQGLLVWASPVIEAFKRILWAGEGAVQGIIEALSAGNIQLAGTIAIAALKSMFWQAAHEIPGSAAVLATSYGQAILAGRWDLLAGIAMGNMKLTMLKAWNGIANIWSAALTGLGAMWDIAVKGISNIWWATVNSIASGILWVMEKLGMAAEGAQAQLAAMNATEQKQRDAAFQNSMASRAASEQAARQQRSLAEQKLAGEIAAMQSEAGKAAASAGVTTAADAANKARAELDKAIGDAATAKAARDSKALGGNFVPGLSSASTLPKVESRGTFSAAAAMAFGGGSNAQEETAKNTMYSRKYLKQIVDKPGAVFV